MSMRAGPEHWDCVDPDTETLMSLLTEKNRVRGQADARMQGAKGPIPHGAVLYETGHLTNRHPDKHPNWHPAEFGDQSMVAIDEEPQAKPRAHLTPDRSSRSANGGDTGSSPDLRTLSERFAHWRNRLIASPRFQNLAMAFPLTRPLARQRSSALFDVCAGFIYTQILSACLAFDLFSPLQDGPQPIKSMAKRAGLEYDAAWRLFKAAQALRLVTLTTDDRVMLGEQGAALLGNPSVFAMVRHHALLYDDLRAPADFFRAPRGDTALSSFWSYAQSDNPASADDVAPYSALMAATQGLIARDVIAAYDFSGHRKLLDIGGGEGAFAAAVGARVSTLSLSVFDLPAVAAIAQARAGAGGYADRFRAYGGDFKEDDFPSDADIVTLVRIIHDHDDAPALALLKKIKRNLPPQGTLVIAEPMAETPGAERMGDAYFGVYLWAMGSGRPRSRRELEAMLRAAGFTRIREHRTRQPIMTRVLSAR